METLTLFELNSRVREAIETNLTDEYWVHAEMSSVHVNAAGHCYIELVQKQETSLSGETSGGMMAKARATIWASRFRMLRPYFEQATGQAFAAGINVQLLVTVSFHELYGLSYVVEDIDPTYTLGDMARRRREILMRLEAEGTIDLNKELPMPLLPQRVAIISSETAAGYGDFCHQLASNAWGFVFRTRLFPAVMQGDAVEPTVIAALDAIAAEQERWDVVVIIRGGGAASDLVGFDTYELASNCAQFPLPIITGIGHERDSTVLDAVANTSVKTPTAAAEFLIAQMVTAAERLEHLTEALAAGITARIGAERQRLQTVTLRLPAAYALRKATETHALTLREERLRTGLNALLTAQRHRLEVAEKILAGASPEVILRRGYTITYDAEGHTIHHAADLHVGDTLVTRFADGETHSIVHSS